MPALLPIILTVSHVFSLPIRCRNLTSSVHAGRPPQWACQGETAAACQRDENDARTTLVQDWTRYNAAQRTHCENFVGLDRAPSYVELLTCLEMAKQAAELPKESKAGTVGWR